MATASVPHPLQVLPTSDLIALTNHLLPPVPVDGTLPAQPTEVARTRVLLDTYLRSRRGFFLHAMDGLVDKARVTLTLGQEHDYGAARLAARGVTLVDLLTAVPALTLKALVQTHTLTNVTDMAVLGVTTLAVAVSHPALRPAKLHHALPKSRPSDLGVVLQVSPGTWLAQAAHLSPRDLRAVGIDLGAWFRASPELVEQARETAPTWLPGHEPAAWAKYAGLTPEWYAWLASPGVKRAVSSPSSGPALEAEETWI
jgi:hypothetical protein